MEPKATDFKKKYKMLKRFTKEIILENAALCDKAEELQHTLLVAQEEQKYLWKKLISFQGNSAGADELVINGNINNLTNNKKTTRKSTPKVRSNQQTEKRQRLNVKRKQSNQVTDEENIDHIKL